MIFFITYIAISNTIYAAPNNGKIILTGIPALIVGLFMLAIYLLMIGGIPAFLIYGIFIRPYLLKKKIKEHCQKNNYKFVEEAPKIPIEKKLYTSNIADIKHYYMIEMGKKQDIAYILCHYFPRSKTYSGYRTICVMVKEGVNIPHFVLGENKPMKKDHCLLNTLKMKELSFKEDIEFSNRFFVSADNTETSNFFNDNIRRVFKEIKTKDYYYEGNENTFVVSYSAPSLFDQRIKLLEFSLDLFNKVIENN